MAPYYYYNPNRMEQKSGIYKLSYSWWLTEGVNFSDCLGAYQFKGVPSETEALKDKNGDHDLTKIGSPLFSVSEGLTIPDNPNDISNRGSASNYLTNADITRDAIKVCVFRYSDIQAESYGSYMSQFCLLSSKAPIMPYGFRRDADSRGNGVWIPYGNRLSWITNAPGGYTALTENVAKTLACKSSSVVAYNKVTNKLFDSGVIVPCNAESYSSPPMSDDRGNQSFSQNPAGLIGDSEGIGMTTYTPYKWVNERFYSAGVTIQAAAFYSISLTDAQILDLSNKMASI